MILKTILKMNFNFNFKDMLLALQASIRRATNVLAPHHTAKSRIKRVPKPGRLGIYQQYPGALALG